MTIQETKILIEKAKNRRDGVYSFNGYIWVAKGGNFVAFVDRFGVCYQRSYSFNVKIGVVDRIERRTKMVELLRSLK